MKTPIQLDTIINPPSDQQLLDDLRTTAQKLNQKTISNKTYRQYGSYYPTIYMRRFGTWNNALTHAGLAIKRQINITAAELLNNIARLWQYLQRQPRITDLRPPQSHFGIKPYTRAFGTWGNALRTFATRTNPFTPTSQNDPNHSQPTTDCKTTNPTNNSKKKNKAPATIPWRLRHLIMKRDNFKCVYCGASTATNSTTTLHIDHIIPRSKGGTNTPENLQTLCQQCNIGKGDL